MISLDTKVNMMVGYVNMEYKLILQVMNLKKMLMGHRALQLHR